MPTPSIRTQRAAEAKATAKEELGRLDPALSAHRVLNSTQAAVFCGYESVPHWRRLHKDGKVPKAVRIAGGRLGWRLSDLIAFNAARG